MLKKQVNRLINQKSPYLLQHAHNPVNWYAWEDEAFEKAAKEDKPIFLSIGYSTCHWCHVMEIESFEDEEVSGFMNDTFISIKVDREERPDIDNIYMLVCQMLTGSGGWPLTIIMTPDKKPFFAGTYFPKEDRFGRMGMINLIKRVNTLWKDNRDQLLKSADEITTTIESAGNINGNEHLDDTIFEKAFSEFKRRFDNEFGGFGNAPKFPTSHNLGFLLRYYERKKDSFALQMVEKTLQEMRMGGIYDQIGFGFHRYSTDRKWLVPHFEKMLYDQALLTNVFLETYLVTQNDFYKNTAEEIIKYVLRDMTSESGGFYSAEDADSEGEEGKFYLWTYDSLKNILNEDDLEIFTKVFNILPEGNWAESDNQTNILNMTGNWGELSKKLRIDEEKLKTKIVIIRDKLFNEREKRIHPFKDDKILTDWNALMISALSKAFQVTENKLYINAAEKAVGFVMKILVDENGRLLHRFRNDEASINGNIDDYAFFIQALLDLYESTFDLQYLRQALKLNKEMIKLFWDEKNGGFFFIGSDSETLLIRQKEIYDGAIPSGNSVAFLNLLRISRFTGNTQFEELASKMSKVFSKTVQNSPSAFTQFLSSLDFALGPTKEIIIVSKEKDSGEENFINLIHKKFLPKKVVILKYEGDTEAVELMNYLSDYNIVNNKTTVYLCENFKCEQPVTSVSDLSELLAKE